MEEEHKKYSTAELLIGGFIFLLIDLICIIIDLTGAGTAIAPIIQGFGTFTMNWWAWRKNDKNALKLGRQIIKYLSNLLPIIPTLVTTFLIETYIHNHPEKFGTLEKITNKLDVLEKTTNLNLNSESMPSK